MSNTIKTVAGKKVAPDGFVPLALVPECDWVPPALVPAPRAVDESLERLLAVEVLAAWPEVLL